jgi:hypothetical protein
MTEKKTVFISYSHANSNFANAIYAGLQEQGFNGWTCIALFQANP